MSPLVADAGKTVGQASGHLVLAYSNLRVTSATVGLWESGPRGSWRSWIGQDMVAATTIMEQHHLLPRYSSSGLETLIVLQGNMKVGFRF